MRVKRRDAEQWMSHRMLPENLKERIRRYEQYKWQETRGVEEDNLVKNLPKDLRRDIKRHLCLKLLMRVSALNNFRSSFLSDFYQLFSPFEFDLKKRCRCLRKWMNNSWTGCVTVSSQPSTQRRAPLLERVIRLTKCSLSCEELWRL